MEKNLLQTINKYSLIRIKKKDKHALIVTFLLANK